MKKMISLLLSMVMLISALSASVNAYAAGWASKTQNIELNTLYTESASYSDVHNGSDWMGYEYYYDTKVFNLPVSGTIDLYNESENERYMITGGLDGNPYTAVFIYSVNDTENYLAAWNKIDYSYWNYSSAEDVYYEHLITTLPAGKYYLVYRYFNIPKQINDTFDFQLSFSPTISKPSYLKATSRSTSSIGLEWGKVGDITGYQVYRNTKSGWKWVADTTKNYYTVTGLKPGVKYDLRVRAYVRADGKNYYSGWRNLATPTKPATVSIKTPSTNSKHQIIAKWSTVADGTGYQVQYSKSKSFSSIIASKYVSGITKTSYTGKNFTKGKTYYVRVRAYKTVDGTKYHGSWSKTKSIKCK